MSDPELPSDSDFEEETPQEQQNALFETLSIRVVRAILSLNHQNVAIHKQNIKKWIQTDEETFPTRDLDKAIKKAQQILEDAYGFTLQPLPPKEAKTKNGKPSQRSTSSVQHWVLINAMEDRHLKFIQESFWLPQSTALFESELLDENYDYRNSKLDHPTLTSDENLLVQSLVLTVLAILVVNNNHMNEIELIQILNENFGWHVNQPLNVIHMTPVEFFKMLDKQEYLIRNVLKNANEEIVEYKVGRRALAEFDRDSFVELVRILYDEPEDRPEFTALVNRTIETTYGKAPGIQENAMEIDAE